MAATALLSETGNLVSVQSSARSGLPPPKAQGPLILSSALCTGEARLSAARPGRGKPFSHAGRTWATTEDDRFLVPLSCCPKHLGIEPNFTFPGLLVTSFLTFKGLNGGGIKAKFWD